MRHIASLFILMLLIGTASANSGTITLYGTNASNTQSNLSRVGTNATVNVSAWTIGDATKTFTVNVSDLSDINRFVLGNFTVGRVIEVKVNGTSYNAYLADSKGEITFNRTQNKVNQTYAVTPALQSSNANMSWLFVGGSPINATLGTANYLPLSGGSGSTMTGIIYSAFGMASGAGAYFDLGSGSTDRVTVDDANRFFPVQVSTTRPAYSQGGFIFNTTTNSPEYSGDNNQWVSLNHFRNITSTGNLTATRVLDTVYQNANTTPIWVSVTFDSGGGGGQCQLRAGLTNPPTIEIHKTIGEADANPSLQGIVPAYYYYSTQCTAAVTRWTEIQ